MDVFILKTQFNKAWDLFDPHELGRRVSEVWAHELNELDAHYGPLSPEYKENFLLGAAEGSRGKGMQGPRPLIALPVKLGVHIKFEQTLDLRDVGFLDKRWLLSCKRGQNLFNLIASIKKSILATDPSSQDVDMDDMGDGWS